MSDRYKADNMETKEIKIGSKTAKGISISMPNANLIMITAEKGYLMCGYLNIEIAERLGDCAAVITGVKTVDDMLSQPVVKATSLAQKAGINVGMKGSDALEKMLNL